jgi:hypothetical protein
MIDAEEAFSHQTHRSCNKHFLPSLGKFTSHPEHLTLFFKFELLVTRPIQPIA